jgi:hypothetical protein
MLRHQLSKRTPKNHIFTTNQSTKVEIPLVQFFDTDYYCDLN